jgi:hypothetical protein
MGPPSIYFIGVTGGIFTVRAEIRHSGRSEAGASNARAERECEEMPLHRHQENGITRLARAGRLQDIFS